MKVQIETASKQDLDRLHEIEKQCFQKEAFSRQQIADLLINYNSLGLVAKMSDQIAGFIIGCVRFERKRIVGHVLTIDVAPESRKSGIGASLLQRMERFFKEEGAEACYLEVREDNDAALALYRKFGYAKICKLPCYYAEAHGLHLRKSLS
jgi:ribosomal-protein-alanine acetyltransferase